MTCEKCKTLLFTGRRQRTRRSKALVSCFARPRRLFLHGFPAPRFTCDADAAGMIPLIVLPLKKPKECELGSSLVRVLEARCAAKGGTVPHEAMTQATELQQQRNKLVSVEKLTAYTAEDAAASFLHYQAMIGRLEGRFDKFGQELQMMFKWRDAFHPSKKSEQADLQWERVGAYLAAAAALSYQAAQVQPKGAQAGGLREAANLFKQAAGCIDEAFKLVKGAIWGLSPRWDPKTLTTDVELPMLEALRQLMLAQAQRAFYEKGACPACAPPPPAATGLLHVPLCPRPRPPAPARTRHPSHPARSPWLRTDDARSQPAPRASAHTSSRS